MFLLFSNAEPVRAMGDNVLIVIGTILVTNSIFEAIACTVVAGGVSRALLHFAPLKPKPAKQ